MAYNNDDDYVIDEFGNRVLIGLTSEETEEFFLLDPVIGERGPPLQSSLEVYRPPQRRWLELYEKHEVARRPFMKSSRTKH